MEGSIAHRGDDTPGLFAFTMIKNCTGLDPVLWALLFWCQSLNILSSFCLKADVFFPSILLLSSPSFFSLSLFLRTYQICRPILSRTRYSYVTRLRESPRCFRNNNVNVFWLLSRAVYQSSGRAFAWSSIITPTDKHLWRIRPVRNSSEYEKIIMSAADTPKREPRDYQHA